MYLRAAVKQNHKVYLVEKSVEHGEFPSMRKIVRGWVRERVVGFVPAQSDPEVVMCVIRMTVEFRGMTD